LQRECRGGGSGIDAMAHRRGAGSHRLDDMRLRMKFNGGSAAAVIPEERQRKRETNPDLQVEICRWMPAPRFAWRA
jgi:hypothetical protein